MQCVSTMSYSVLVNGEPSDFYVPTSGLRQGDPLSPYLFILCMKVLSKRLRKLQRLKKISGLKIGRYSPALSHLFFKDDALFSFKANPSSCRTMRACIDELCDM